MLPRSGGRRGFANSKVVRRRLVVTPARKGPFRLCVPPRPPRLDLSAVRFVRGSIDVRSTRLKQQVHRLSIDDEYRDAEHEHDWRQIVPAFQASVASPCRYRRLTPPARVVTALRASMCLRMGNCGVRDAEFHFPIPVEYISKARRSFGLSS